MIDIVGYSLVRADHPSNTKNGGFCIYYKDFLPLTKNDDWLKRIFSTGNSSWLHSVFLSAVIRPQAKTAINLVISLMILVYFLTI